MKRFRLTIRLSDRRLDALGVTDTGEDAVLTWAAERLGQQTVEQVQGLDVWPDPPDEGAIALGVESGETA